MAVGVFTLVIFVLAIGFAILSGWLADRKGYSFPLFAFLGFLGPVAVIIAAVMPSKKLASAET